MKYQIIGKDREFEWEWETRKTCGKMWDQPLVGTLNFEITFNEDFSARDGILRPAKMKFLKLKLKEERKKITSDYVEYEGTVTGLGQHRTTKHRIYRDTYAEVLSGGEEGTLERKATITPMLSEENWKKLQGENENE